MARNPFSAGRWVSGDQFFGRDALIGALLQTDEPCNWVIGKRRMGKTSLLRELERRVNTDSSDRLALFWDIQGSFDTRGLFDSLYDAIEDSRDSYPEIWEAFELALEEDGDTARLLKQLARTVNRVGRRLLLLIDETEELMTVGKGDPGLLSKLRRFMQTNRNTRTIMVSSPRLERLGRSVETMTSPFLHGFYAHYLGNFEPEETRRLLRGGIEEADVVERILDACRGNPFETQLTAKHYFEERDLDQTMLQLETNPTLAQTIEVNINLLEDDERELLEAVHLGPAPFQDFEKAITSKLYRMGYLLEREDGGYAISSYFMKKWLAGHLLGGRNGGTARIENGSGGLQIDLERPSSLLRQVVSIYRAILELGQGGRRIRREDGRLVVGSAGGPLGLDPSSLDLEPLVAGTPPWWAAVEDVTALLAEHVSRDETWSVFRLHQMTEKGPGHYAEKEFLDLMMLIAEEANLD